MKILMFNWKDLSHPTSGGAEVLTEGILKELTSKGHDVTLFCSKFMFAQKTDEKDGYKIIRRGAWWTVQIHAMWWWFWTGRKQKFDKVIDQIHGIPFFTPLFVRSKDTQITAFIHEVANEIWYTMFPYPIAVLGSNIEKFYLRLYKRWSVRFITVSNGTKLDLINAGIRPSNIGIIAEAVNPPNPEWLEFEKAMDPTVIFLGRIAPMKQLEQLIEAVRIAQDLVERTVTLWVVGHGDDFYSHQLLKLANSKKVDLKFMGKIAEHDKYELLTRAWVLASCSLKEGYGLVVVEAGLAGTPAVTYNVAGFNEAILDGKTGFLSAQNTPQSMAEIIAKIDPDTFDYERMQEATKKHNAQFTFDRVAKEFLSLI